MTRATDERNARNETMVQRLHDAGYPITMDDLHAAFPGQTVLGRPHIAALLVQRGWHPLGVRRYARPARPGQGVLRPAL